MALRKILKVSQMNKTFEEYARDRFEKAILLEWSELKNQKQKALEYLDLWQSHNEDTTVLISIQDLRNILERKQSDS